MCQNQEYGSSEEGMMLIWVEGGWEEMWELGKISSSKNCP